MIKGEGAKEMNVIKKLMVKIKNCWMFNLNYKIYSEANLKIGLGYSLLFPQCCQLKDENVA